MSALSSESIVGRIEPTVGARYPRAACRGSVTSQVRDSIAPFRSSFGNGHRFSATAEAEHATNCAVDLVHRVLAVLRVVKRAGWGAIQYPQVQIHQIVDVDIGPDILAAADMFRDPMLLRQSDHLGNLDAVWIDAASPAVNQGRGDDYGTHALFGRT
jgi:hypothetical protein